MKRFLYLLLLCCVCIACQGNWQDSNPLLYTDYLLKYPAPEIGTQGRISLTLQDDIPSGFDGAPIESLFTFSPSVKGSIKVDKNTLTLLPDVPLLAATTYRVSFHLGKIIQLTDSTLEEFRFSLHTKPIGVQVQVSELSATSDEVFQIKLRLTTSDVCQPSALENIIKLTQRTAQVKLLTTTAGKHFEVLLDNVQRTEEDTTLAISYASELRASDHNRTLYVQVPRFGSFDVMHYFSPTAEQKSVKVLFSSPLLSNQDLRGLVEVVGAGQMQYDVTGNALTIYTEKTIAPEAKLIIRTGVKDTYGRTIETDHQFPLQLRPKSPYVRWLTKGNLLPDPSQWKLYFEALNYKAVAVRISRIRPKNILPFLQRQELHHSNGYELRYVKEPMFQQIIALSSIGVSQLNVPNTYALDLSQMIKTEKGAIYHVELALCKEFYLEANGTAPVIEQVLPLEHGAFTPLIDEEHMDYDWDKEDDPTADMFYRYDNQSVATNIMATSLGVMVKATNDNHYTVVANNMLTAAPEKDAKVQLLGSTLQVLAEGSTASDGVFQAHTTQQVAFVVATKGEDTTYLPISSGSAISISHFDTGGGGYTHENEGYLYSTQGVFRPGVVVPLGFMYQPSQQQPSSAMSVKLSVLSPTGKPVFQEVKATYSAHHYLFHWPTAPDMPTGHYRAKVEIGPHTFFRTIRLDNIKPNRLKIENSLAGGWSYGALSGGVQVSWLQGMPAAGSRVELTAKFHPLSSPFKSKKGFVFLNTGRSTDVKEQTLLNALTDSLGQVRYSYAPTAKQNIHGVYEVAIAQKASETGGDYSLDACSLTFSPLESYVGIRVEPFSPSDTDEEGGVQLISLTNVSGSGEALPGRKLRTKLFQIDASWWWDVSQMNLSAYTKSDHATELHSQELLTNHAGDAQLSLRIKHNGRYFILATDPQSGHTAAVEFYINGYKGNHTTDAPELLHLTTDKPSYKVGERAVVRFPSAEKGKALISVEHHKGIIQRFWHNTTAKESSVEISITEEMLPNAYVSVSLLQPYDVTAEQWPMRLFGIANIGVSEPKAELFPQINMPDELAPNSEVLISISERDGQPMDYTISIVEEGSLALTNFKTPAPYTHFFQKKSLGVHTWDMYPRVIGAFVGEVAQQIKIGGSEAGQISTKPKASRFKPFNITQGVFAYDGKTPHKHRIRLPNYVGKVRVMVVASKADKYSFGSTHKSVEVKSSLMALLSAPRKAAPQEEIVLPVTLFALDEKQQQVRLHLEVSEHFEVLGSPSQEVRMGGKASEQMAYFTIRAKKQGVGTLRVVAQGTTTAYAEAELPVFNPNEAERRLQHIVLAKGATHKMNISPFGEEHSNYLEVELSGFVGAGIGNYLEQAAGQGGGNSIELAASGLMKLCAPHFQSFTPAQTKEQQQWMAAAMEKLQLRAQQNGGYPLWKSDDAASHEASSMVAEYFIAAKEEGYPTPLLPELLEYQREQARKWSDAYETDRTLQAHRLYTLARAGEGELSLLNRMHQLKNLSATAQLYLALSYAYMGQQETALLQLSSLLQEGYSSTLEQALLLELHLRMGKNHLAQQVAVRLWKELRTDAWVEDSQRAKAISALSLYVRLHHNSPTISAALAFAGAERTIESTDALVQERFPIKGKGGELTIVNTSGQTLYGSIAATGVPAMGQEGDYQNGLALHTHYTDTKGNPIDIAQIKQGTSFVAHLQVQNLSSQAANGLQLTQHLPSGWEIITPLTQAPQGKQCSTYEHLHLSDEKALYHFSLQAGQTKLFALQLTASYLGKYYMGGTNCVSNEEQQYSSRKKGQWVKVIR